MRRKWLWMVGIAFLAWHCAAAQETPASGTRAGYARPAAAKATPTGAAKIIRDSEDAMGMLRSVERIDAISTMEFWASGASYEAVQPDAAPSDYKVDYHANLGYLQPGFRLEIARTKADGTGTPQKTLEVVNDKYAWNESELGAGLTPGKGTATPVPDALKPRLLRLWLLPYGAMKAATIAGENTKATIENGATVLTFPLSGALTGLTTKVTLDNRKMVSSVETQSTDPALRDLVVRIAYSDYGDYGQAASDLMFPRRITETKGGRTVLDLTVREDDPYNPYEIFWTPPSVGKPDARSDSGRVTTSAASR